MIANALDASVVPFGNGILNHKVLFKFFAVHSEGEGEESKVVAKSFQILIEFHG